MQWSKELKMLSVNCPVCGTPAPEGAIFCDKCGYDLRSLAPAEIPVSNQNQASSFPSNAAPCPACGHVNRAQAIYCERCGVHLASELLPAYQPPIGTLPSKQTAPSASIPMATDQELSPPPRLKRNPRLVISGTQVTLWFPPAKTEVVLGREDAVSGVFPDINLEPYGAQDAGVSRRHLQVNEREGAWFIEDLNSVNGTFLNQQRLSPGQVYPLKLGDVIRLGKLDLEFLLD